MNWTKTFPEEFAKRRGYDIKIWIPVLAGRIVKNIEASEKFLWDFRKTIGELIVESHYDVIGEELHKRGMKRTLYRIARRRTYLFSRWHGCEAQCRYTDGGDVDSW